MRDTTLLLIYYGPVLNAPAIFEVIFGLDLVVVTRCYGCHKIYSRSSTCTFDKERSAAHVADRLMRMSTIYCVFVRFTYRYYNTLYYRAMLNTSGMPARFTVHSPTLSRSAQGSKSWHSGSFAKYSDIGLVIISFPACCVSHRATGLPVMVHDMHTRRRRPDYLQACPTGLPVDGDKSALTPAL